MLMSLVIRLLRKQVYFISNFFVKNIDNKYPFEAVLRYRFFNLKQKTNEK